jgi:hypothetical protein
MKDFKTPFYIITVFAIIASIIVYFRWSEIHNIWYVFRGISISFNPIGVFIVNFPIVSLLLSFVIKNKYFFIISSIINVILIPLLFIVSMLPAT